MEESLFRTYKFWAIFFSYPEEESFFKQLFEFASKDYIPLLEELKKVPLEELQAEWTKLFIANFGGVPCKPYQSFFGEEKELMGAPAFSTNRFYRLFNLDTGNEYPDRANLQLDFAAFLVKLYLEDPILEDRKRLETLYKEFFKKHILWMVKLAECVEKNTSIEPLKGLMEKFKEFLLKEKNRLKL